MLGAATHWQLTAAGCATYSRLIRQLLSLGCRRRRPLPHSPACYTPFWVTAAFALLQGCGGIRLAAQARLNMTCRQRCTAVSPVLHIHCRLHMRRITSATKQL